MPNVLVPGRQPKQFFVGDQYPEPILLTFAVPFTIK